MTEDSKLSESMDGLIQRNRERDERKRVEAWKMPTPMRDWQAHGLRCVVLSGPSSINGYAFVPEGHPWHSIHYSECPSECGESWCEHTPESRIEVHGGITFSHLGDDGGWIFGFDTAHHGDHMILGDVTYDGIMWNVESVGAETESMAEQLAQMTVDAPA